MPSLTTRLYRYELFLLGEGEKKVTWELDTRKWPRMYSLEQL